MDNELSIILVVIATIINSIVFGYIASNSKNNKTNVSYLFFLGFIIFYTIFDCIIIQLFNNIEQKNIIVKIQAGLWMPLSILYLNFIYIFLRKPKDKLFYFFSFNCLFGTFISIFTNKVLIGYKDFNLGTMAYTGSLFLPITFLCILPGSVYALYLIAKEGKIFNFFNKTSKNNQPLLALQLKILFFGSILCLFIAVVTNIFFDELFGYTNEIHLASLSLSIQSIFLLPALIKYNFLNRPMESLGDELFANSSDAVIITDLNAIIVNLNNAARRMFKLSGKIVNQNVIDLFNKDYQYHSENNNYETITKFENHVTITQTDISKGNQNLGKILVIRDISPRIEAELKYSKSEKSYKNLIESSSDIIYNIDLEGRFTYVNKVFEKISEYKKESILGKNSIFLVRDDYKIKVKKIFNNFFKKNNIKKTVKIELPIFTKSGYELWMELGVSTIIKNNLINGFTIISRDITDRKSAETKLAQIADELTTAQNIAGLGSFKYNIKNDTVIWSDKLYEIYGRNKKEFKPSNDAFFNDIVHPESKEASIKKVEKAIQNKSKKIDYIHKALMPDKSEKWFHAIVDIVYDDNNQPILMNGTSQDITQIYEYQEKLRELYSHIQNVQEEERGKIAHEIHDELGQRLTSMNMDLTFLISKLNNNTPKEISLRLNELDMLVDETIQITRKISQELRPSILDNLGLVSALEWLQDQYAKRSNLKFFLNAPDTDFKINKEYATTIFRITQEALTNIVRHANASKVIVDINKKDNKIFLNIKDDGKGINIKNTNNPTFGILGMKERALALGGKTKIISNKNAGTSVYVTLPL